MKNFRNVNIYLILGFLFLLTPLLGIIAIVFYYFKMSQRSDEDYVAYKALLNFELTIALCYEFVSFFPSNVKSYIYGFLVGLYLLVTCLNILRAYIGSTPIYPLSIDFFRPFLAVQKYFFNRHQQDADLSSKTPL
jgi:uncharacterized Tic20 family protein